MICTRKEFMALAGVKQPGHLTTFIQRGKVILESDGKIDTEKRENKDFITSRASKGIATPQAESLTNTTASAVKGVIKIPVSKKVQKAKEATTISKFEVDLQKSQADLYLKELDSKIKEIKIDTLTGNSMPIEFVKELMAQVSKSVLHGYNSYLDQKISDLCHQYRIPNDEKTKILSKNTVEINKIHSKVFTDAAIQIKNAIGKSKIIEAEADELGD